jgi:hypothetical protein
MRFRDELAVSLLSAAAVVCFLLFVVRAFALPWVCRSLRESPKDETISPEKKAEWDLALDDLRITSFIGLEGELAMLPSDLVTAKTVGTHTVVFCEAVDVGYTYNPEEYERKVDRSYTPLTPEEDRTLGALHERRKENQLRRQVEEATGVVIGTKSVPIDGFFRDPILTPLKSFGDLKAEKNGVVRTLLFSDHFTEYRESLPILQSEEILQQIMPFKEEPVFRCTPLVPPVLPHRQKQPPPPSSSPPLLFEGPLPPPPPPPPSIPPPPWESSFLPLPPEVSDDRKVSMIRRQAFIRSTDKHEDVHCEREGLQFGRGWDPSLHPPPDIQDVERYYAQEEE